MVANIGADIGTAFTLMGAGLFILGGLVVVACYGIYRALRYFLGG